MRTLRKVFCILSLAALVTSSAAMAAPTDRSDPGDSIGSWALSVLNSIVAFVFPDELAVDVRARQLSYHSEAGDSGPPNEIVGGVDPNGSLHALEDGEDPPSDEVGAVFEPGG